MQTVMNAQQMRAVDKYMIDTLKIPGIVLMENAAMGTAQIIMKKAEPGSVVHVFCGTGNNGGDGLACARILMAHGYNVYVVIVGDPSSYKGDAKTNFGMFSYLSDHVLELARIEDLYTWRVPKAEIIVDALFGTGLDREVKGIHAEVIDVINRNGAQCISIDMPSGISADNGAVLGQAVRADVTVTFQYPKIGQILYPGRDYTGDLTVVPIGISAGVEDVVDSTVMVVERHDADIHLAKRASDTNKGSYGRLFIVAGSRGMAGAAVLTAQAAYRAGAGLVSVGVPESITEILQTAVPEATCLPLPEQSGHIFGGSRVAVAQAMYRKTAMALGPGLGQGEGIRDLVTDVIGDASLCRVLDADALNAIGNNVEILAQIKGEIIFTPHPAEFARLLGMDISSVLERPLELASTFSRQFGVVLVLKGATTVIADTDGSAVLLAAGTPGMAKGGSGDVLTGVIAGFAAQGFSAMDAAILGTYFCAMAGECAADEKGTYSMTPLDTISELGKVIGPCLSDDPEAFHPENMPQQITDIEYTPLPAAAVPRKSRLSTGAPKRPVIPVPAAPLVHSAADAETEADFAMVREQTGRHLARETAAAAEAITVEEEAVEKLPDKSAEAAVPSSVTEEKPVEADAAKENEDLHASDEADKPAEELAPHGNTDRIKAAGEERAPGAVQTVHKETRRSSGTHSRRRAGEETRDSVRTSAERDTSSGHSEHPAASIRRSVSQTSSSESTRSTVSQDTGRYHAAGRLEQTGVQSREGHRSGREEEQRRREEEERELVRAKLRNEMAHQGAADDTGSRPRSRAEAARQEADVASGATQPVRPQAAAPASSSEGGSSRRTERQREIASAERSEKDRPVSERPAAQKRPQPAAAENAESVSQNTRIAPPVKPQAAVQETSPAPDTRSEAQRHRDELNAQIQRELKNQQHEKPVQRTRRRIG